MMKDLRFEYRDEDLGWVSEEIALTGDTYFLVLLKKKGRVTVKKRNGEGEPQPKVHVTPITGPEFELLMTGDECEGKLVQLVTSEEPEYMRWLEF